MGFDLNIFTLKLKNYLVDNFVRVFVPNILNVLLYFFLGDG